MVSIARPTHARIVSRIRFTVSRYVVLLMFAAFVTPLNSQTSPVAVATTQAQTPTQMQAVGAIRGVVYDSLVYRVVPQALVWVPGTQSTTVSDSTGEFRLTNVPAGAHFVAFSTPALDSLGLGTLGHKVAIAGGDTARLDLATPSFLTLWRGLCAKTNRATKDSGIVWGTIRDATTDSRLSNAPAAFTWNEVDVHFRAARVKPQTHRVRADSTGTYYACGLPPFSNITSEAAGTSMASGQIQYIIGSRRILRVDMLVSPEMVLTLPTGNEKVAIDSLANIRARGTASLRGIVRDENGRILANATVRFPSSDSTVYTNEQGQFSFNSLPAGTHILETRQVGYTLSNTVIDLRPGKVTDVAVSMPKVNELDAVNVRDKFIRIDRQGFLERRMLGYGIARDSSDYAGKKDIADIFEDLPDLYVTWSRNSASITVGSRFNGCTPVTFLNGIHADMEAVMLYKPKDIIAYEYFEDKRQLPLRMQPFPGCGALLLWTHKARW